MNSTILKSIFVPGGVLFICAVLLLETGLVPLSAQAVQFYFYAVFLAGILLAWRFHSSRIAFALLTLFLSYRAIEFFSANRLVAAGPGRIAFHAVAFLLPLNLIFAALARERGFTLTNIAPRLGLLFFESVFVAIICRPGEASSPGFLVHPIFGASQLHWSKIPQVPIVVFAIALSFLFVRLLLYRRPVENGLMWSTAATFMGLQAGALGKIGDAYFATAGLILVSSIIENSYALAYHDELTGLPSRRAFNDALLTLGEPYSIAVADIDHFKSFNDTHGHETGDQILRLVAGKLGAVTGGGRAYRVGGEEFSILFAGKSAKEVLQHLEDLRAAIEVSRFRLRALPERRAESRGSDRRTTAQKSKTKKTPATPAEIGVEYLSVTVSIGVAEATSTANNVNQVIESADKALYRAKRGGRNRVEIFRTARSRTPRTRRRSIAS